MTDLPEGWREATLSRVVDVLDSKRKPVNSKARAGRLGTIPYYGATGQVGTIDTYLFDEELVLLGEDGAPFLDLNKPKAYLVRGKSWVNNHAHVLRCREGVYLNQLLVHFLNDLDYRPFVNGTTRLKLTQGSMNEIPVAVPPLVEQERIVEILEEQFSRLDSALASIKMVREKAAAFRRSLLHAAFSGELTGGTDGWREVPLSEVCEYVRGVTYGKSDATDKPTDGFLPLLRATNITEVGLTLSDFVYVPNTKVKPVQVLRSGDLVMAASSGSIQVVGKSAPVPEEFVGTFGAFCAVLRPNRDTNHQYLNYFISSPKVRESWSAAARGTNINNLKREPVLGTAFPLAPLTEQERIVEILEEQFSRLDSTLGVVNQLETRIASERRSLLHAAFTGALTTNWRDSHV